MVELDAKILVESDVNIYYVHIFRIFTASIVHLNYCYIDFNHTADPCLIVSKNTEIEIWIKRN